MLLPSDQEVVARTRIEVAEDRISIAVAWWVVLDAACGGRGKDLTCVNPSLPREPGTPNQNQNQVIQPLFYLYTFPNVLPPKKSCGS